MKNFTSFLVIVLTTLTVSAFDFEVDGIYYDILSETDKTVAVVNKTYVSNPETEKVLDYIGDINIPQQVSFNNITYNVICIKRFAFARNEELKSVSMPNSIINIEEGAFGNCINLESVKLSENITTINHSVFSGCEKLSSIDLPKNITEIRDNAFDLSGLTEITIPENCEYIDSYAFALCDNLKKVTVNAKNIFINESFSYSAVEEISFAPNSTIQLYYANLTNLKKIIFNENIVIQNIDGASFNECLNIEEIFCNISTPPTNIDNNIFNSSIFESYVLKVPASAIELYKNANVWKNFKNIVPIDADGVDEIVADGNDAVMMSVTGDYITLTGIEAGGVVAITDLAGRNILSLATSDNSIQINTSDLNPGCYIIFYSNESVNWGEKVFISK